MCGYRTVRFLKLWHRTVGPEGANLMAAGEHKWHAGAGVTWLGNTLAVSLGLVWIPHDKRLRAINAVDATLAGKLPVGEYRRLVGLYGSTGAYRVSDARAPQYHGFTAPADAGWWSPRD